MHNRGQKHYKGKKLMQSSSYERFLTFKQKPWNVSTSSQTEHTGQGFTAVTQPNSSDGQASPFSNTSLLYKCFLVMKKVWMTLKSAAMERHLLTLVEFPTGFLNSRTTLMLPTLRKAPHFLGEAHGSREAQERSTMLCHTQWPIQPSVLSSAVAVSQWPRKTRTRLTLQIALGWGHHDSILLLFLHVSFLPVFTRAPLELLKFSQP